VLLRLAGLPAEPQFEIELGPSWRVYADLAYPDEMLIVEYDGAWHGAPERVQADQRRRDALRAAGWAVLVFTDSDFHGNPNMIVETVSEALTAARARRRQ
jgi:very-short-patch-repair endonuclease